MSYPATEKLLLVPCMETFIHCPPAPRRPSAPRGPGARDPVPLRRPPPAPRRPSEPRGPGNFSIKSPKISFKITP